jgi:hypothetical protein
VRDKASEIEALITLLEKRLINKETLR